MAPFDPDRSLGALLGLAVGDALGGPLEFLSADEIGKRHEAPVTEMVGGGWLDLEPGQVTDDTQMALCLGESLVARQGFDPGHVLEAYLTWFRTGPPDVGATVREVLRRVEAGESPNAATAAQHEASGGRSAGNGALMRTTPIAIAFAPLEESLRDATLADARLTHYDPLAGKAALLHNQILAWLLKDGIERVRGEIGDASWLDDRLEEVLVPAADGVTSFAEALAREAGGYVVAASAVSLAALFNFSSFEEGLVWAVNLGGDADTNGAVAGALLGARFGAGAIPARWLDALVPRTHLEELHADLVALAG